MFAFCLGEGARSPSLHRALASALDQSGRYRVTVQSGERALALHASLTSASVPLGGISMLSDGGIALFDGWFDNLDALATELGLGSDEPARVYSAAVDRWGDQADRHVIGKYAAVVASSEGNVRLARSAIEAQPLSCAWVDGMLVVASLPRLLLSAGLPTSLSKRGIADAMFLNTASGEGWFEGSSRLDVGHVATIGADKRVRKTRWWQPEELDVAPLRSDEDIIARTDAILREAIAATTADAANPGMLLSGGLDSSNVAARLAETLPAGTSLPGFTFVPSKVWDGSESSGGYGSEREKVEQFARRHPAIEPRFVANEDREFDSDWDAVFAAIGCAPPGLTNIWMYHGIFEAAREAGCDILLSAESGNQTISIAGEWAAAEYLRRGRARQSWRAAAGSGRTSAGSIRKWLRQAVVSQFPDSIWKLWQAVKGREVISANERIAALNPQIVESENVVERALEYQALVVRQFPSNRRQWIAENFNRGDLGAGELELAFEQLYGIRQRDVCAYRPLVEHCLTLPTELFMRDGTDRWLARELGKGLLPDEQRLERRQGMHQADWHARMTPRLPELRAELLAASQRPELREIFDFDAILARIDHWPTRPRHDYEAHQRYLMGIPIALMTMRFIRRIKGWNTP